MIAYFTKNIKSYIAHAPSAATRSKYPPSCSAKSSRFFRPGRILGAALLAASALPALAQQTVNIAGPLSINYSICGNATNINTGNCAATNDSGGNTVTVDGVTPSAGASIGFAGGLSMDAAVAPASSASHNQITVTASTADSIFGGVDLQEQDDLNAEAMSNVVTMVSGTFINVTGGNASAAGGNAVGVSASLNTVTVQSGTVSGNVYGGDVSTEDGNTNLFASDNNVFINGGSVYNVVGGSVDCLVGGCNNVIAAGNLVQLTGGAITGNLIAGALAPYDNNLATSNTVDIGAGVSIAPGVALHGGMADSSTGNILNLRQSGLTVVGLDYFQQLNFFVPANFAAGGAMLTASSAANLDYADATVSFQIAAGSKLAVGDKIVLISSPALTLPAAAIAVTNNQGYTFDVTRSATELSVTLKGLPPAPVPVINGGVTSVPTLGAAGLGLLALLLSAGAALRMRRSKH